MNTQIINESLAVRILSIVDKGLSKGLGNPVAGQMCVEAAVCFAMGLPHSDNPPCVGAAFRAVKIRLNDANWSSDAARAAGMRELSIVQLGTDKLDQVEFAKRVALATIKEILPIALKTAKLHSHAIACEQVVDLIGGKAAANAAAYAAANATPYAAYAANAAAYAADATAYAADAADATAYAAANAAYAAANAADAAVRDSVLSTAAKMIVRIAVQMGAEGAKFLHLCN